MTDPLDLKFVKVPGHRCSNQKNDIDRFFSLVDKASRYALREMIGYLTFSTGPFTHKNIG
jgi:hypothetical protein